VEPDLVDQFDDSGSGAGVVPGDRHRDPARRRGRYGSVTQAGRGDGVERLDYWVAEVPLGPSALDGTVVQFLEPDAPGP
jgi:hypothetical protein